jgi:hypothetical protein
MGTHTQSVMDRATSDTEEAKRLGECIVAWLVDQEIIQHRLTDCCYKPGYPPGSYYRRACGGIPESEREADYADFLKYNPNGMELSTTRNAFFHGQGDYGPARCPHCAAEHDIDLLYAAADVWLKGGEAELACMKCGQAAPVTAWEHDDLLFGTLGLQFWGWPDLSPGFLLELERRTGHRWTRMFGKL